MSAHSFDRLAPALMFLSLACEPSAMGNLPAPRAARSRDPVCDRTRSENVDAELKPSATVVASQAEKTSPGAAGPCGEAAQWASRGEQALDSDPVAAARSLERACDLDDPKGCTVLGTLLLTGVSGTLARDERRGLDLTKKGCDLGSIDACRQLGNLYQQGSQEPGMFSRDLALSFAVYRQTCRAGDAYACASLAHCYEAGLGVAVDAGMARQYRWMAEELGYVAE
jgi:hypothetical protein